MLVSGPQRWRLVWLIYETSHGWTSITGFWVLRRVWRRQGTLWALPGKLDSAEVQTFWTNVGGRMLLERRWRYAAQIFLCGLPERSLGATEGKLWWTGGSEEVRSPWYELYFPVEGWRSSFSLVCGIFCSSRSFFSRILFPPQLLNWLVLLLSSFITVLQTLFFRKSTLIRPLSLQSAFDQTNGFGLPLLESCHFSSTWSLSSWIIPEALNLLFQIFQG